MIPKAASHLVNRRGVYHFRIVVPIDLRPVLGRNEVRRSLRTAFLQEARPRALRLTAVADRLR
ncbi:hypothetical protein GGQ74_000480 [Desulfobaculum xiamenense]|uniref:DUF6538 domain-containing protein n=1 Tax=Desulfobaculum xiamenense TaxID=995050 RepID=A0A846QIB5_9BACT|nr:DUF6538 domain-containing protein [Desulfobaculum xiamenense]NJB66840.1 hypothetical protein [Desulfobaculum xiamenense]